jgi:hypothetical protein
LQQSENRCIAVLGWIHYTVGAKAFVPVQKPVLHLNENLYDSLLSVVKAINCLNAHLTKIGKEADQLPSQKA